MSSQIPQVSDSTRIVTAEFVRLTIPNTPTAAVFTFSSSYQNETFAGHTFLALGGFIGIGQQHRDLQATSADLTLVLGGIGSDTISSALHAKLKGSTIEVWRGFYNDLGQLEISSVEPITPVRRYTGIITSYTISESREETTNSYIVTLNASSYKELLENKFSGRKTNPASWNSHSTSQNDSSMNNVPNLDGIQFDFGKPVVAKSSSSSAASLEEQQSNDIREAG